MFAGTNSKYARSIRQVYFAASTAKLERPIAYLLYIEELNRLRMQSLSARCRGVLRCAFSRNNFTPVQRRKEWWRGQCAGH